MIPIQELLSRIRWDKEFGEGSFEIGYLDQRQRKMVLIPLEEMFFEAGNRFSFRLESQEGEALSIPFHRIREVHKNGSVIWKRKSN